MTYPAENLSPTFKIGAAANGAWASFGKSLLAGARQAVTAAQASLAAWGERQRYGRRVREMQLVLSALDDKLLDDIGLHRGQIDEAARRAVDASIAAERNAR